MFEQRHAVCSCLVNAAFSDGGIPLDGTAPLYELEVRDPVGFFLRTPENDGYHVVVRRDKCLRILNGVKKALLCFLSLL